MIYQIKNGSILPQHDISVSSIAGCVEESYIGIFPLPKEISGTNGNPVSERLLTTAFLNRSTRFESREHLDLLCLNMLDITAVTTPPVRVYIFIQKNFLQFYCEDTLPVEKILKAIMEDEISDVGFGQFLYFFFEHQLTGNLDYLEKLESGITKLEDEVLINKAKKNYTQKIMTLRKNLMTIKRHYEQLLDILSYMDANENGLFDKHTLKLFRILDGKTDRLYRKTVNLMDYVSEIREAYQAEVDINLNTTMKLLTVITVIFLPLTLIAGWYGMNFNMPEYGTAWGYPSIILISLLIAGGCVFYFKKHDWF